MKIVIVDDSLSVRKYVKELLADFDDLCLVGEASDIEEGLTVVLETKPDVLILDIIMPGGSGLNLLRSVTMLEVGCKVVILSNSAEEQFRTQARGLGAAHFLDKAFEFEKLIDAIRN